MSLPQAGVRLACKYYMIDLRVRLPFVCGKGFDELEH
jgi:hypothetical protein